MLDKFEFEGRKVRTFGTWDNPLFVAQDVCKCLKLDNASMACSMLDEDEKDIINTDVQYKRKGKNVTQLRKFIVVTESGLYALIFQSRKEEAKRFKKWVTSVVLPEIRKTGSYNGNKKTMPLGIDPSRFQYYRPLEDGKAKRELTFFISFYDALYALDNRINKEPYHQHPPYFAQMTIKYVYDELEDTGSTAVIKELKTLRKAHEEQGVKGIQALHQLLSPEGKRLLERTIAITTMMLNMSRSYSNDPEVRRHVIKNWLLEKHGQLTLPIAPLPRLSA